MAEVERESSILFWECFKLIFPTILSKSKGCFFQNDKKRKNKRLSRSVPYPSLWPLFIFQ